MNFNNPYWTPRERVSLLQRWILVHSIIYYEMNRSVVQDHDFDRNCRLLMRYKSKYEGPYSESSYYEVFKDFDGTTGFDLYHKLDNANMHKFRREASYILDLAQKNGYLTE